MSSEPRTLLFIPTYNEAGNVERMCRELCALEMGVDIMFCDDGSPDGTGPIIDRLAEEFPRVLAMHRAGKLGIGSAHQDGIRYAYEQGYQRLLTMDGDFTHQPADARRLLEASGDHAITVASRYLQTGSLLGWNLLRRSLTRIGHFLTVNLLHMPQDATGALRCYRLDRIPQGIFGLVRSQGYSFFFESLFVLQRNGHHAQQVAVTTPARAYGHSKMTMREVLNSAMRLLRLIRDNLLHPERQLLYPDIENAEGAIATDLGSGRVGRRSSVYAFLAGLYRKLAVRRSLDAAIHKHFPPGARLLHAGCGMGQVDQHLSEEMKITAVDISLPALERYRRNNPHADRVRRADIRSLDFEEETFDGAYNLGVVEHYTPDQIETILTEMGRVVKRDGKIVIFWPHHRKTNVLVLRTLRWLRAVLSLRFVRSHRREVSLLDSREQARAVVEKAGFSLVDYYFGMKDLLVQTVVVGQKV